MTKLLNEASSAAACIANFRSPSIAIFPPERCPKNRLSSVVVSRWKCESGRYRVQSVISSRIESLRGLRKAAGGACSNPPATHACDTRPTPGNTLYTAHLTWPIGLIWQIVACPQEAYSVLWPTGLQALRAEQEVTAAHRGEYALQSSF